MLLLFLFGCSKPKGTFDELMLRGGELVQLGKKKDAYRHFKAAISKKEVNGSAHYAASKVSPDNNTSYRHVTAAWDDGLRSRGILYDYLAYSFFTSIEKKKKFAFSLFEELPLNLRTEELKGELLYFLEDYDSALVVWSEAFKKKPDLTLAKKLASVYAAKGLKDSVKFVLQEPAVRDSLDERAIVMLASSYALSLEYDIVDSLFEGVRGSDKYLTPLKLEDFTFQFLAGNFDYCLNGLGELIKDNNLGTLKERFEILYYTAAYLSANNDAFRKLDLNYSKENDSYVPRLKKALLSGDGRKAINIVAEFNKSKGNNIDKILMAALLMDSKQDSLAYNAFKELKPLYRESFAVLPLFSALLAKGGQDSIALSTLEKIHSKGYYSNNSLRLKRDIYMAKGDFLNAISTHKNLDIKFPERGVDPGLARIYAYQKRFHLSDKEYLKIIKKNPSNCSIRKEFAKGLFNRAKYRQVDVILRNGDCLNDITAVSMRAEAFSKLNKSDEAEKLFTDLKGQFNGGLDFIEAYSLFLYKGERYKDAFNAYKGLSSEEFEKISKRGSGFSRLFINNYLWRKMKAKLMPSEMDLTLIKQIYENSGGHSSYRSTYASALRASEKYVDCLMLYKNINKELLSKYEFFILADCRFKLGYYAEAGKLFNKIKHDTIECLDMNADETSKYIVSRISESGIKGRKNVN